MAPAWKSGECRGRRCEAVSGEGDFVRSSRCIGALRDGDRFGAGTIFGGRLDGVFASGRIGSPGFGVALPSVAIVRPIGTARRRAARARNSRAVGGGGGGGQEVKH